MKIKCDLLTVIHNMFACSFLIAPDCCMESWLDLYWEFLESKQSPNRLINQDQMDLRAPTTHTTSRGTRITLRGLRLPEVVDGTMYGETTVPVSLIHPTLCHLFKETNQKQIVSCGRRMDLTRATPTRIGGTCRWMLLFAWNKPISLSPSLKVPAFFRRIGNLGQIVCIYVPFVPRKTKRMLRKRDVGLPMLQGRNDTQNVSYSRYLYLNKEARL